VTDEQIDQIFIENPKNLFDARTEREAVQAEASVER
jgi:hypothetical protein